MVAGRRVVLAIASAIGLAVAVSGGLAQAAMASASPALPSQDPFYRWTGPLAGIRPGTVLRSRSVQIMFEGTPAPVRGTQLLYRTQNELGQPSVTVATVLQPELSAGPTKLVSYQTFYDALGDQCDPSYTLQGGNSSYSDAQVDESLMLNYVDAGDTVVTSDYEGESLDWAAGQESGWDTLDAIRAAEHFLGLDEHSTPVAMVGYSGGSIATDFAAELAPGYAPGLHIVGTAMGGVPVDFFHNLSYVNGSSGWAGVIPAVLVSLSRAFHLGNDFDAYLSPYGLQVTRQVANECINSFAGDYPGLTIQKLLKPQYSDYLRIHDLVAINDHLIMSDSGTPREPMLIGVGDSDGTGDGVMITRDVEALAHTYCQRGVPVQFHTYSGLDHEESIAPFESEALSFLTTLLNGGSEANGCGSIGTGNSLAPNPIPPALRLFDVVGRVRRGRRHGLELRLASAFGPSENVVVALFRDGRRIARTEIGALPTSPRTVLLYDNGRSVAAGSYLVRISQGGLTLLSRNVRLAAQRRSVRAKRRREQGRVRAPRR